VTTSVSLRRILMGSLGTCIHAYKYLVCPLNEILAAIMYWTRDCTGLLANPRSFFFHHFGGGDRNNPSKGAAVFNPNPSVCPWVLFGHQWAPGACPVRVANGSTTSAPSPKPGVPWGPGPIDAESSGVGCGCGFVAGTILGNKFRSIKKREYYCLDFMSGVKFRLSKYVNKILRFWIQGCYSPLLPMLTTTALLNDPRGGPASGLEEGCWLAPSPWLGWTPPPPGWGGVRLKKGPAHHSKTGAPTEKIVIGKTKTNKLTNYYDQLRDSGAR